MDVFQEWNPEMHEMEFYIQLAVAAVTLVVMCCCCCCCLWINRDEDINAEFDSRTILQEIEVIERQSANYEDAIRRARKRHQRQLENENLNYGEIGILSDSWEALDENVNEDYDYDSEYNNIIGNGCDIVIDYVTNNENDSDLNCGGKDENGNTSNVSNDSDIKSKSEDTIDKCLNETSLQVDKLCESLHEKSDGYTSSVSNDSVIKSISEDNVDKCDSLNGTSHQVDQLCESSHEKSDVNTSNVSNDSDIISKSEDNVDKCDSSNETSHQVDKFCESLHENSDQYETQVDGYGKANVEDDSSKCDASNGSNVGIEDSKTIDKPGS